MFSAALIAFSGNRDAKAGSAGIVALLLGAYLGFYGSFIVRREYFMDNLSDLSDVCKACKGKKSDSNNSCKTKVISQKFETVLFLDRRTA